MKKIKVLAIAGVFTASLAGAAFAEMADVKIGGEIRVRAESVNTDTTPAADSKEQAQYIQRTRINVDAKINETTKAYIQLQDSRIWGEEENDADTSGAGVGISNANEMTGTTGQEVESVDVSQAYFQLDKLAGQPLSLRVGRQALAYGDHRLIGSFEWSNNARRFDALKLMYNTDAFSVDLWTAKVIDLTSNNSDTDFNGLYATIKSIPNNTIDLYLLQDKNGKYSAVMYPTTPAAVPATERDIKTLGLRLNGKVADLDYTGEFAKQTGDYTATKGQDAMAYALKAGYTIPAAMGLRIGAEYDVASGNKTTAAATADNKAFQNLYPTNHYLYGFTDDVNWSNIKATALTVSAKPVQDLSVGIEYWMYTTAEKVKAVTAAGVDEATKTTDDAGTELNLMARYKLNPNVSLEATYVMRTNGDAKGSKDYYGRQLGKDDSATFSYLQANVTF